MHRLQWSDGTRAKERGEDLAGIAKGLSDPELEFWLSRFGELPLYQDLATLESEAARRWGPDWKSGPLFRKAQP